MNDSKSRIVSIDAARGTAMLFSCLAHFGWWLEPKYPLLESVLSSIGMVATPTFLLLSGATTGVLCASPKGRTIAHKYRLLNRGLFLLTVGHLLISLAESHHDGGLIKTIIGASIVDEIGLAMIFAGVFYIPLHDELVRRRIGQTAIAAFLLLWLGAVLWHPDTQYLRAIRQALLGPDPNGNNLATYTTPTLQYLTVFAMGLSLGSWFAKIGRNDALDFRVAKRLVAWGTRLTLAVVTLCCARIAANRIGIPLSIPFGLDIALKISAKSPPSPAYLAFYAGIGMILTAALIRASRSDIPLLHALVGKLSVIGRASLFVFVLQYFIYWTLPDALGIQPNPLSGPLFIGDLVILWFAARWWGLVNGNRLLTIGLRPVSPVYQRGL
jgi:uncharacterized membrane protein